MESNGNLDLLFVMDTSDSLDGERRGVVNGLSRFLQELPANTNFNIAVLLAHGKRGTHSGRLFQTIKGEELVLKSKEQSLGVILDKLEDKLLNYYKPVRYYHDGELGLYSLSELIRTPSSLSEARDHGFFRENATLAVVFIADENDICHSVPSGVTPITEPNINEVFSYSGNCDVGDYSYRTVFQQLRAFQQGRPMLLSGIIYTGENYIQPVRENEIGYGYKELIELGGGHSVNIGANDIPGGLSEIGQLTNEKLKLQTRFKLSHEMVEPASISVLVDGENVPFYYVKEVNEIVIGEEYAGGSRSLVKINYCTQ